jgi:hypothetical protein
MRVIELAGMIDVSTTKARRYAKELLAPDPEATRQSGKAREINDDEGFIIWLGLHLVNKMGFSMNDAKAIINDLRPWMESKGLFPDMKFKPDGRAIDYDIQIKRATTASGFWYLAKGWIHKRRIEDHGESIMQDHYYSEKPIMDPPVKGMMIDEFNISTLQISILLKVFLVKIGKKEALKNFNS